MCVEQEVVVVCLKVCVCVEEEVVVVVVCWFVFVLKKKLVLLVCVCVEEEVVAAGL